MSQSICDFIEWAEWWLCGGQWTMAARRWRYSPEFVTEPRRKGGGDSQNDLPATFPILAADPVRFCTTSTVGWVPR